MDKCNKGDKYQDILEKGTPNKQHEMAKCLVSGMGFLMKKPVKMAETLFKAAADKGHLDSAYEFYILSEIQNKKGGLKYLKFAASKGHDKASTKLIFCHLYGPYMCKSELDPQKGITMLQELVDKKNDTAYSMMAACYEKGIGVPVDLDMSKKYYKKSKSYFKKYSITRLDMLIKERDSPSKKLREEIVKKYSFMYKIVNNKIVPI